MITKKCQYCNSSFTTYPYAEQRAKFCSKKCADKDKIGKVSLRRNGKYVKCQFCGKEIYLPRYRIEKSTTKQFFCNAKCLGCYKNKFCIRGHGRPSVIKRCAVCGKEFRARYNQLVAGKGKVCSKECSKISISKTLKGRRNPEHSKFMIGKKYRYIKDRSKVKTYLDRREDALHKEWRILVYKRDGYKCRICSSGSRIEAHHILRWAEYPELRYQVNNGITLCHDHHPQGAVKEKRLRPYLMRLVSVSKV